MSVTDGFLFQIEDVGSWLKNLRLHKYGSLFSQLSYEEMLGLNEEYLESKVCRQLFIVYLQLISVLVGIIDIR